MLIGIVGKPSSGKSTFFRAATLVPVEVGSRPFVTLKPNRGVGFVRVICPGKILERACTPRLGFCENNQRFVPVDMLDVAGLVPGAHEGEGMGLQFMSDLNEADVLVHIIDASGSMDAQGREVGPGGYDPLEDAVFLEKELDYWYLGIIKKGWDRFSRKIQMEKKDPAKSLAMQLSGLRVTENMTAGVLKGELEKPLTNWSGEDLFTVAHELRKRSKPMLIAANKADLPESRKNIERLKERFPEDIIIPCSAEGELALREAEKKKLLHYLPGDSSFEIAGELSEGQEKALSMIKKNVLEVYGSTGIQNVLNTAVFELLKYKAIFPGGLKKMEDREGRVLADCFIMPPEATALDFAYRLHTDFGKNFIKAVDVKTRRPVGKDHVLKDGDVIEIMAKA